MLLKYLRSLFYLIILATISSCKVGPDFKKPEPPKVDSYTTKPTSLKNSGKTTGGGNQTLVNGQDISGEWWKLFKSKSLDDLIARSLKNNPNLKSAQAALTAAHESTLAQYGAYYPSVSAGISGSRQKTSKQLSPNTASGTSYYSLYTPQVSVAYIPDVFGLNARTIESLKAQEEQVRFSLIATYITLSSNVVNAAITEASLRYQIAATKEIIAANTDMLKLLNNQYANGSVNRLIVAAQEAQLAQVKATLPPLLSQLTQQRNLLATLAGDFPNQDEAGKFDLGNLQLPKDLPLSLPSKLVEQRPDVRQAEENLHSASAQIGISVANRLPNLTITSNLGTMSLVSGQIFRKGSEFADLGLGITQPIFAGGSLMHRERAARAAYVQAAEQYKSVVLNAFQNVADTLTALEQDANTLTAALDAKNAAQVTLDLTKKQLQSGTVNYLALLSAESTYQQASINLIQAQANRYADTAALFQALGGGWWNIDDKNIAQAIEPYKLRSKSE